LKQTKHILKANLMAQIFFLPIGPPGFVRELSQQEVLHRSLQNILDNNSI